MSLLGTDMKFLTEYAAEFTRKEGSHIPYLPPQDSDPVSTPWHQYLVPDESLKHLLPKDTDYEDPKCVIHRAHLQIEPDFGVINHKVKQNRQTVYQHDFCALGDFQSKKTLKAKIVPLPPNWMTPLSTQRCSYRDPKSILTLAEEPYKFSYKDNLVPNEKEREILRVKTGDSDYMANIGTLGEFILREKLHGEVKLRGLSQWEVKRRMDLLDKGIIEQENE